MPLSSAFSRSAFFSTLSSSFVTATWVCNAFGRATPSIAFQIRQLTRASSSSRHLAYDDGREYRKVFVSSWGSETSGAPFARR